MFKNQLVVVLAMLTVFFLQIAGVGHFLNVLVMKANGGRMPVLVPGEAIPVLVQSDAFTHPVNPENLRFAFLCDHIAISADSSLGRLTQKLLGRHLSKSFTFLYLSPGDILILLGLSVAGMSSDLAFVGWLMTIVLGWISKRSRQRKGERMSDRTFDEYVWAGEWEEDDRDALGYVFGTLSPEDRLRVQQRAEEDHAFQEYLKDAWFFLSTWNSPSAEELKAEIRERLTQ